MPVNKEELKSVLIAVLNQNFTIDEGADKILEMLKDG